MSATHIAPSGAPVSTEPTILIVEPNPARDLTEKLSGASGAGIEAVLDKLLEAVGQPEPGADDSDEDDAGSDWSPI